MEIKVAELMLPFNGLSTSPEKSPRTDWGEAMHGLRFIQSLNLHGNDLDGSLATELEAAFTMTRNDQFMKRPLHFGMHGYILIVPLCRSFEWICFMVKYIARCRQLAEFGHVPKPT